MKRNLLPASLAGVVLALSVANAAVAAIREEPVTYKDGDTVLKGYVVYDDASTAKRPGIVVVPTWWGINKHMLDEARHYADEGYTAFIADMFGDGRSPDNPKEAGPMARSLRASPATMLSRFKAAKDVLENHISVDASRIGAVGYSLGGGVAIDMARAGSDLKGVAGFYVSGLGSALAPGDAGTVTSKLLVMNGASDPMIKPESVEAFEKEMTDAKVDYRYVSYPGAMHSYTDPDATEKGRQFNIPFAYDAQATQQSRAETSKFFSDVFKQ